MYRTRTEKINKSVGLEKKRFLSLSLLFESIFMTVCKSKYVPKPEGNVDSETQNKNKRTNGLLKLMAKLP